MMASVYVASGDKLIGRIEVPKPICGIDFCERCEDCMSCWRCSHERIVYKEDLAGFLEEHNDSIVLWLLDGGDA